VRALIAVNQDLCPLGMLAAPLEEEGMELEFWSAEEETPPTNIAEFAAVIALGGGANPDEDERYPWLAGERDVLRRAVEGGRFVLGVCLGAQLLAQVLGSRAFRLDQPEIGWYSLKLRPAANEDPLLGSAPSGSHVFEWHSRAFTLPPASVLLAGRPDAVRAFRFGDRVWGLQYHIEADEEIVASWIRHYDGVLRATGRDPEDLANETKRRASIYRRLAASLGRGFAAAAREHRDSPGRVLV
jgi:GMP synthase-like glutamine amidotransferase